MLLNDWFDETKSKMLLRSPLPSQFLNTTLPLLINWHQNFLLLNIPDLVPCAFLFDLLPQSHISWALAKMDYSLVPFISYHFWHLQPLQACLSRMTLALLWSPFPQLFPSFLTQCTRWSPLIHLFAQVLEIIFPSLMSVFEIFVVTFVSLFHDYFYTYLGEYKLLRAIAIFYRP